MKNQHLMERPCETPAYVSLVPGVRLRSRLQTQTISLTSSDVLQDAAAMRELYELTYARLFGMVMRIVGRREAAEDVLQEKYYLGWSSTMAPAIMGAPDQQELGVGSGFGSICRPLKLDH
jgi:hypothetical protein